MNDIITFDMLEKDKQIKRETKDEVDIFLEKYMNIIYHNDMSEETINNFIYNYSCNISIQKVYRIIKCNYNEEIYKHTIDYFIHKYLLYDEYHYIYDIEKENNDDILRTIVYLILHNISSNIMIMF